MGRTYTGSLDGRGRRVVIAAARFNRLVTDLLVSGAVEELRRHGVEQADVDLAGLQALDPHQGGPRGPGPDEPGRGQLGQQPVPQLRDCSPLSLRKR